MAEIEKEESTVAEQPTNADEVKEEKSEKSDKKEKKEKKDKKADKTEKALEDMKKELDAQKNNYLRLAAEYDNYRKRTTNEKASIYADATAKTLAEILTVADSLEMAVKAAENAPEEFKKGIELVAAQMESALTNLNVEKFGKAGEKFDPELHNAVSRVDDESLEENVIAQVFQSGYKTGDRIIRHAMVQVANCD